jgi:hypothetical protein
LWVYRQSGYWAKKLLYKNLVLISVIENSKSDLKTAKCQIRAKFCVFLNLLSQVVDLLEFSAFPIAVSGCFLPAIIAGQHEKRPPSMKFNQRNQS